MRYLFIIGFVALSLSGFAQEKIETLEHLKQLEQKVKDVVAEQMEVTVSILSSRGGAGSGVIVSEDGLILTAAHVIRGEKMVEVVFPDGRSSAAKVLGANYSKDSALCKMVEKGPWKFAEMASSKDLEIGEYLVAMGHPGGFDTVRTPPVRFGRLLSKNTNHFITTDATLIGGDSGGPLFNLEGKVVGIHSNIGNTWNENNHAGISGYQKDWERLLKGEQWGVMRIMPMVKPDSPIIGILNGKEVKGGVEIGKLLDGGPCDKAGIKTGDVIKKFNGYSVLNFDKLRGSIMKYDAGDEVVLTVSRAGKELDATIVLGRREDLEGRSKE